MLWASIPIFEITSPAVNAVNDSDIIIVFAFPPPPVPVVVLVCKFISEPVVPPALNQNLLAVSFSTRIELSGTSVGLDVNDDTPL